MSWRYEPWIAEEPCPVCGGEVHIEHDCPGWPDNRQGGKIMVCIGCGNALRFDCQNEDCGWWTRVPNNRSEDDMGEPPQWVLDLCAHLNYI